MSDLPKHARDHRETVRIRDAEKAPRTAEIWQEIEAERHAVEERTARLRAMRLAHAGGEA